MHEAFYLQRTRFELEAGLWQSEGAASPIATGQSRDPCEGWGSKAEGSVLRDC